MKCPWCCAKESKVKKTLIHIDEDGFAFGELKKRERECLHCGERFNTFEIHEAIFRKLPPMESGEAEDTIVESRRLKRRRLRLDRRGVGQ